ncbi:MAG TPA: GNAT family N-acetyltransferase [Acidobacteriota bacterium]|nr:GNAT family N-acetyltransferase [Acidobacteriota bacterium]
MEPETRLICIDKKGCSFEVGVCCLEDLQCLLDMYEMFSPRPVSQGLPPASPEALRNWIKGLLEAGENLLAWRDERVVGHAALIPDYVKGDCEFIIFVGPSYRNRGIGAELTRLGIERAKKRSLESVWLTVETYNFRAVKLYKKFRFEFCDRSECERIMILKL